MPLFPDRSPTLADRLSDRRRALTLVGLAAAALIGAKAARRKLAEGPSDYTAPTAAPVPSAPSAPTAPLAPTPPPAAADLAEAPVAAEPEPAEPEPVEPNTEELAAAELAVLAILSQEGRLEAHRTALAVATTLERETVEVAALLRKLHNQGHVVGEEYTATGAKIWNVTDAGAGRLD